MVIGRVLPLLLAGISLGAQAAPSWGVGLLGGSKSGKDPGVYGSHLGVDGSWQFLRDHWVQGRLRLEYLHLGPASPRSAAEGALQDATRGDFFVFSCDWIFRLNRPHGPYALLGTGLNAHTLKGDRARVSGEATGNAPSFVWGLGWHFAPGIELEFRQEWLFMGALGSYADAFTSTVALRRRF